MKYNHKIIILFAIIIFIIFGVVLDIKYKKDNQITKEIFESNEKEDVIIKEKAEIEKICFYKEKKTDKGFYDIAWLSFELEGLDIKGEFRNLPSETDSMIGDFEGKITHIAPENKKEAKTIWNSFAEGMYDKRELNFSYTKENAFVDFAGMTTLDKMDCDNLSEKLDIEEYVRENIKDIATNEEVLGGTWYVTKVLINPEANTGEVSYEDGHIASDATFIYEYNKKDNTIKIINFKEKTL